MATFDHIFEIGFRDVGMSNKLTNRALLGYLEDIAGMHSNEAGFGLNDIERTGYTWILLNWKVRVFSRPIYGEKILVKTWARKAEKFYTFRDYQVFDGSNNLVAIATTKWVLINAKTMGIEKIPADVIEKYYPENVSVFEGENEVSKLADPKNYSSFITYRVQRKDIDINKHMHNIYYLDLAYEALPDDVFDNCRFQNIEIMYKKEIRFGETVKCFYSYVDNSHYITIKSEDEKTIHAIIKFNEFERTK